MLPIDDPDPLPCSDAGAELQRESFLALQVALGTKDWIVRDERIEDLGVDLSLEVLACRKGTNFRSQVQVKGRSKLKPNEDGSYSVSVDVANLSYLLRGPTPLYVLYRPENKELLLAFAHDELRRIAAANPNWKTQTEITIRFRQRLDQNALEHLRDRIVSDARAALRLKEIAASVAPGSHFQVAAGTLEPHSPLEAEKLLLEAGMSAVTQGFANQVSALCASLNRTQFLAKPKLLLVRGYAEFTCGRYIQADAPLREALAAVSLLAPDDRHFLKFLVDAVDLALGHASREAFRRRLLQWRADAPPLLAAQYDVLHSWILMSETSSEAERGAYERSLRNAITRVRSHPDAPQAAVQNAEMLELRLDAQAARLRLADILGTHREIWHLRFDEPRHVLLARENACLANWRIRADALSNAIVSAKNVPLYCELRHSREICEASFISQLRLVAILDGQLPPEIPDELIKSVRKTQEFAAKNGLIEIELRSALVEGDLEDMRGDRARLREISQDVYDRATALRFADIAAVAHRTLAEGGQSSALERVLEAMRDADLDPLLLTMTEGDLKAKAREACEMLRQPPDRIPALLDGLRCELAGAVERRDWCRHLCVMELALNRVSAVPPEKCCVCRRFGHKSHCPNTAWGAVIAAFKANVCRTCGSRNPRQGTP